MRKTPSLTLIESDPENMKRVQRISMQYESINVTPTSPVPQRRSPREPKKIDLPLETNVSKFLREEERKCSKIQMMAFMFQTLMDELHSKLRSRKEKAANKLSTIDSKDSKDSKDSFFEAEFSVFPEVMKTPTFPSIKIQNAINFCFFVNYCRFNLKCLYVATSNRSNYFRNLRC